MLSRFAAAAPFCRYLELRLDAAAPGALDLPRIVRKAPRPLVVTCRSVQEGGRWAGTEDERLAALEEADRLGPAYLDLEWDAIDRFLERVPEPRSELIVSRHRFGGRACTRGELFSSVRHPRAAIQKVADLVDDAADALALLDEAKWEERPTVAIAMGFPGVVSRLAGGLYGSPLLYAAADPERPAAPGQLSAQVMSTLLAHRSPGAETRLYGVVGDPVGHSRSPELHNGAFAHLGEDAVYSWLETRELGALLSRLPERAGGLSVTIPHKVTATALDGVRLAESARAVGALNTLLREGDGWRGENTDALAAVRLLAGVRDTLGREAPSLRLALLGSGGAARAVAWATREVGGQATVFARNEGKGRALAADLGASWGGALSELGAEHAFDVICNATSVGMQPHVDASPIDPAAFRAGVVAYDLVYTPPLTRFLREAMQRGAAAIDGLAHFAHQARAQLEFFVGQPAVDRLPEGWLRGRL